MTDSELHALTLDQLLNDMQDLKRGPMLTAVRKEIARRVTFRLIQEKACPNPHCDHGVIRGTGVGCSICMAPQVVFKAATASPAQDPTDTARPAPGEEIPGTYESGWRWNADDTPLRVRAEEWLVEEADVYDALNADDEESESPSRTEAMRGIAAEITSLRAALQDAEARYQWLASNVAAISTCPDGTFSNPSARFLFATGHGSHAYSTIDTLITTEMAHEEGT